MSLIKFNLVKLEKMIIYQPISINSRLDKYYNMPEYGNHHFNVKNKAIYLRGNPELLVNRYGTEKKFAGIFLGMRDESFRELKTHMVKFNSNEERDEYYSELLSAIKEVSELYKKELGII